MRAGFVIALLLTGLVLVTWKDVVPVEANPVSYTLWGRSSQGWGFTSGTITTPGPLLTAMVGETVVMSLHGADNPPHTFWIDYDGDGATDVGEPLSPIFSGSSGITYSFVTTSVGGTYTYLCSVHPNSMFGSFTVTALQVHDVAVQGLVASRNFAYAGVPSNPIRLNVTAANLGSVVETFTVSLSANTTIVGTQTITLGPAAGFIVQFSWSAENFLRGNYVLSAKASQVSGETNVSNNVFTDGICTVRFNGDLDGNCTVNILDMAALAIAFDSTPGSATWNPGADLNNDGQVTILDVAAAAANFDKSCG